jgi:hypothetical protein
MVIGSNPSRANSFYYKCENVTSIIIIIIIIILHYNHHNYIHSWKKLILKYSFVLHFSDITSRFSPILTY